MPTATPPLVWLAPMSGSSDAPFRSLALRFGADQVVSEMVACRQLSAGRPDMLRKSARHEGPAPWIVQLSASEPGPMRAAAALMREAGADGIDVNFGCPARKVTGMASGSALMRDPEQAERILAAAAKGADGLPLSLKLRLGWDQDMLNAPLIIGMAKALGFSRFAIHARTRMQFYKGKADWVAAVDAVAASAPHPIAINGDIICPLSARAALEISDADDVMVGRAAVGRPWLLGRIAAALHGRAWQEPPLREKAAAIEWLVARSAETYGERNGVRVARKHVAAFLEECAAPNELRRFACTRQTLLETCHAVAQAIDCEMVAA